MSKLNTCFVWLTGIITGEKYKVITEEEYNKLLAYKPDYEHMMRGHHDDLLADMMKRQRELYDLNGFPNIDYNRPLGKRATEVITTSLGDFVTSMIHEAVELQNWFPWKAWSRRLGNKVDITWWSPDHFHEIRMEVIDLVCFLLNICCLLGIDHKMIYELYNKKMDININERHNSGRY
jgi:hypothetical protein